jgi:acyl carrier protein
MLQRESLFDLVRLELVKVAMTEVTADDIGPDSLLIEELGVDSLSFVDLALALEDLLEVDEFPMQAWVDECVSHDQPLTVGSLVAACDQLVRPSSSRPERANARTA